jgi:hypothetical protein
MGFVLRLESSNQSAPWYPERFGDLPPRLALGSKLFDLVMLHFTFGSTEGSATSSSASGLQPGDARFDPFGDDRPLEFGQSGDHVNQKPAGGRGQIDAFPQADHRAPTGIEIVEQNE